jgi:hypothetical protein
MPPSTLKLPNAKSMVVLSHTLVSHGSLSLFNDEMQMHYAAPVLLETIYSDSKGANGKR